MEKIHLITRWKQMMTQAQPISSREANGALWVFGLQRRCCTPRLYDVDYDCCCSSICYTHTTISTAVLERAVYERGRLLGVGVTFSEFSRRPVALQCACLLCSCFSSPSSLCDIPPVAPVGRVWCAYAHTSGVRCAPRVVADAACKL